MRTPSWESSPGALAALLNGSSSTQVAMADLYTFTLLDNTVLRYTGAQAQLTINGLTFLAGPKLARNNLTIKVGIEVATLNITLNAEPSVTVGGVPMIQWISKGALTNARVKLERLFAGTDNVPVGTIIIFSGRVGDVKGGRHTKTIEVLADTELLNVMVPAEVYQPTCKNNHYGLFCKVSRAAFQVAGIATSTSDATQITCNTNLTQADSYFDQGVVTFTSGANEDFSRTVKSFAHAAGALAVILPWPFPVAIGDTFEVAPGCDKTPATCAAKYSNLINFRAESYMPAPITVT